MQSPSYVIDSEGLIAYHYRITLLGHNVHSTSQMWRGSVSSRREREKKMCNLRGSDQCLLDETLPRQEVYLSLSSSLADRLSVSTQRTELEKIDYC